MRLYKNSAHHSLTSPLKKNPAVIRIESTPTQTIVYAEYFCRKFSFHHNFGLIFTGLEDMGTDGVRRLKIARFRPPYC